MQENRAAAMMTRMKSVPDACPCGAPAAYTACCGRYHAGEAAPDAEAQARKGLRADELDDAGEPVVSPRAPAGAQAIPTMGEWALALLAGALGLFSLGALRRRGA